MFPTEKLRDVFRSIEWIQLMPEHWMGQHFYTKFGTIENMLLYILKMKLSHKTKEKREKQICMPFIHILCIL